MFNFLMNPAFWESPAGGAITSFGLPALSQLFGAGRAQVDFQNEMKKLMSGDTLNKYYNDMYGRMNHMAAADRASILTDSNAFTNSLQSAYARAGMSGIGATAATAGSMVAGNEFRRLNTSLRQNALEAAMTQQQRAIQNRAALGPNPTPGLDALGAGVSGFQGFLNDYFQRNRSRGGYSRYGVQSVLESPQMQTYFRGL